jgi:hypothetical protein
MKQKQHMGVHMLLTIQMLEEIIKFLHPRTVVLLERIEQLHAPGPLPAALYTLTNSSDADFVTLGGLLSSTDPHRQILAGTMTPAPLVAIHTPLDASAGTSDGDLDSNGQSGIDESMDDEFAAAADSSVSHRDMDQEIQLDA